MAHARLVYVVMNIHGVSWALTDVLLQFQINVLQSVTSVLHICNRTEHWTRILKEPESTHQQLQPFVNNTTSLAVHKRCY